MNTARGPLSLAGQLYVGLVATGGIAIVLHSVYLVAISSIGYQWFVLAGLTLLSGSFTIRIPTIPARLSVSETFVFTAAILFGPAAATVIVVLDSLIISFWLQRSSRSPLRVLFNMSAPAIAIWAASHVFFLVARTAPLSTLSIDEQPRILTLVGPLLLLALLYFLLNSSLIAAAVGFEKRISPYTVWRDNFVWLSLNYFSGVSVAALLLPFLQDEQHAFVQVAGLLLPLLLISYLTFKTALGRVEDANRHLTELNRLYLSTIETLAMAIDAKDQITHGHIRRVQTYAVKLAVQMGVKDTSLIRAVEAAALLHDMGKLAVPEYILNKPGPLTPAEFDKMKLHASAGADILSAINFPYPVVPIVRHHHENWDGTGYPDGIAGADIPIGARILSVVDCFDALTSDRPYRPRLPDRDALRILTERRGTMYDPLVVDTFLRVHSEIVPEQSNTVSAAPLQAITSATISTHARAPSNRLDEISSSTEEMLTLFSLARGLTSLTSTQEVAHVIATHLRRLIPSSLAVFYMYNAEADDLVAAHVIGEHAGLVTGLRIGMGQRLSGWVAANRLPIRNSDPVLDFGDSARGMTPRPRSCLSTPLLVGKALVGVLTLYSTTRDAFTEEHQRVSEIVGRQVAPVIQQCEESERLRSSRSSEQGSSLPHLDHYEDVATSQVLDATAQRPVAMILVRIKNFDTVQRTHGRAAADATFDTVVRLARAELRLADMMLQCGPHEFMALLLQTDQATGTLIANRIADSVALQSKSLNHDQQLEVGISIVCAPQDGSSTEQLIRTAARRQLVVNDESDPSGNPAASIH